MDIETLRDDIIKEEGGVILEPYKDHLGYWTIGAGHLIRDNEKEELMKPITKERAVELFMKDFNIALKDMETFSEGMDIDDNAKECVTHMVFQLGLPRLQKFVKFKECLKNKDYTTHNFMQWYVAEQIEEEALARTILDKLKLIGDDKGGLYLFDRDILNIEISEKN